MQKEENIFPAMLERIEQLESRVRVLEEKMSKKEYRPGRPKKDETFIRKLYELKQQGIKREEICKALSISQATYYRLLSKLDKFQD